MASKKRVGSLNRSSKEFPSCRDQIEKQGLVPHILCDAKDMYWDGLSTTDNTGRIAGPLSSSFRAEMMKMIQDGRFGEGAKLALIDLASYWRVRDALVTWPSQERIEQESLTALKIKISTI